MVKEGTRAAARAALKAASATAAEVEVVTTAPAVVEAAAVGGAVTHCHRNPKAQKHGQGGADAVERGGGMDRVPLTLLIHGALLEDILKECSAMTECHQ